MPQRIQLKRGLKAALPTSAMLAGEPLITTDRGTLHIATDATTKLPVVPAIEDLATLAAVSGDDDLLIVHDASEVSGQKEKKITVSAFKAALNLASTDSDEKLAVVAGGTAGYLWGTDGTDGILRLSNSLTWTKDVGNGFVTLAAGDIDGGTF